MKKNLAIAMMLAGACATAGAAEVVLVTGTAQHINAAAASATAASTYTITGVAGKTVGAKFFDDQTAQDGSFVKVVFSFTGGNNVLTTIQNDAANFGVASTSIKGNQVFGGNATVGAVRLLGACAASPCVQADVDGAGGIQAAMALGVGS